MTTPTYEDLTTQLRLQWVDFEDAQATQRALIEVTPDQAHMELPRGKRGEKGDKGDPGPAPLFRAHITDRSQLPRDLTQADWGAAYVNTVTRELHVWDGFDWFHVPDFVGVQGEPGETPQIQVGSVTPGGEAAVSVNRAASNDQVVVLDFVLPQGPRGPQGKQGEIGEASNVSSSPDVDVSTPPDPGDALTWNGSHWAPRTTLNPIGPWMLGPSDFTPIDVGTLESGGVNERIIASYVVPGLPFDWRPVVVGGLLTVEFPIGVHFNADIRVGNAQKGDIVGHGVGKDLQRPEDPMLLHPWSTSTVTPGSTYGVVQANTATTIYVVLVKVNGSIGGWKFHRQNAGLTFYAQPVNGDY